MTLVYWYFCNTQLAGAGFRAGTEYNMGCVEQVGGPQISRARSLESKPAASTLEADLFYPMLPIAYSC